MTPLHTILTWFETGDFPTQQQFAATFSSFFHKSDQIPYENVNGLDAKFNLMLPASQFASHLTNEAAHAEFLAKKDASNINVITWREALGVANIATVDGATPTGNVYTKTQIDEFINQLNLQDNEYGDLIEAITTTISSFNRNEFNQSTDSDVWYINHNLNRAPIINIYDYNGIKIEPDEVKIIDANNIEVRFLPPTKGKAILI